MTSKITMDATNKPLGRLASEAAVALAGKRSVAYQRHAPPVVKVEITNGSKVILTGRKAAAKYWRRYSGYPGGLRKEIIGQLLAKKGHGELIRRAIFQMLDNNKLRPRLMKNLIIHE